MSDQPTPSAVIRSRIDRTRRLSLIWSIPLITALIAGWLAWSSLSERGPLITVTFETAEGLQANQSHVRHKDVDMGVVQKVALSPDLKRVVVTIRMSKEAEPLLTDKARFWVVKPRFFAGSLTGLETLVSGAYIDLLPSGAGGTAERAFTGLEEPPVLQSDMPGRTVLLKAARIGSLNLGSPVMYRDMDVGQVLGWDVGEMADYVMVHAFIRAPFDKYVHDSSRFWNASGASVSLGANGLQLHVESLRALALGGIAFETPNEGRDAPVSTEMHEFSLYPTKEAADAATFTRTLAFAADFTASVAGLSQGAAVTMHGIRIGEVKSVGLRYDKATDAVTVPVRFDVEPERIARLDLPTGGDLDSMLRDLVRRGLRVKLESANLITGQKQLALDLVPTASLATLRKDGDTFILPVLNSGSGDITADAAALVARLNAIPFEQIGQNLNQALAGTNGLVNDPGLRQAVADARTLVDNLNRGTAPVLARLPGIAQGLDDAVHQLNRLSTSLESGYGANSQFGRDTSRLLVQLTDAARSIRVLADLLSRHPEALIRGRTEEGTR